MLTIKIVGENILNWEIVSSINQMNKRSEDLPYLLFLVHGKCSVQPEAG